MIRKREVKRKKEIETEKKKKKKEKKYKMKIEKKKSEQEKRTGRSKGTNRVQAIQLLEEVVVLRGLVDLVQVHAVLVVEAQPAINLVLDGVALLWVGGVLLDDLHRDLLTGRLLHRELDNGERPAVLHTVWLVRRKARGECRGVQSSVVTGVHPAMCYDGGRSVWHQ